MQQLTRTQYKAARRQLRDNGRYALRWMDADTRCTMELVLDAEIEVDPLAVRAQAIADWRRFGVACNVSQTRAEVAIRQQATVKERQRRRDALTKFDRQVAIAQRLTPA